MITRKNYEKYTTDYWDNQLTPLEKRDFEAFLLANPDIAEQLDAAKNATLSAPHIAYPRKQVLKYLSAADENSNEYPRIKADKNIVFEKKNQLYRKPVHALAFFRYSAAALILLLISVSLLFRKQAEEPLITTEPVNTIVENTSTPVHIVPQQEKPLKSIAHSSPEKTGQQCPQPEKRQEVMQIIPNREVAAVLNPEIKNENKRDIQQIAQAPEAEIILNEKAREWKSSSDNFQSKNIFTSALSASRSLAEKIRTNE